MIRFKTLENQMIDLIIHNIASSNIDEILKNAEDNKEIFTFFLNESKSLKSKLLNCLKQPIFLTGSYQKNLLEQGYNPKTIPFPETLAYIIKKPNINLYQIKWDQLENQIEKDIFLKNYYSNDLPAKIISLLKDPSEKHILNIFPQYMFSHKINQ